MSSEAYVVGAFVYLIYSLPLLVFRNPRVETTWWDGVAATLAGLQHAWLDDTVPSFVAMAGVQVGESVLGLGYGFATVTLRAKQLLG